MSNSIRASISEHKRALIRSRSVSFSLAAFLALTAPLVTGSVLAANLSSGTTDIDSGAGNTFDDLHVGPKTGPAGINVHGSGVKLTITNGLFVGDQGGKGSIQVYDSGVLAIQSGGISIGSGGGTADMLLSGTGSQINVNGGSILVGDGTSTGLLLIEKNAVLTGQNVTVGAKGTVTVDTASTWTSTGAFGLSGQLNVLAGSKVETGASALTHGGVAAVTGSTSSWKVNGDLDVGSAGTGVLSISDGATVSSTSGRIGDSGPLSSNPGSMISGKVQVTGQGSQWNINGVPPSGQTALTLGSITADYGQSGELAIEAGGRVSAASLMMRGGSVDNGSGGKSYNISTLKVDGAQSELNLAGGMAISGLSAVNIANGGKVVVGGSVYMGVDHPANPANNVTVSGVNSLWQISGGLEHESGSITLTDGGRMTVGGKLDLESRAVINVGAASGLDAAAAGTFQAGSIVGTGGRLVFNHTDGNYSFAAPVSGAANIDILAGITVFSGANSYTGTTNVAAGTLRAGANQAFSANSDFAVKTGAKLDLGGYSQNIAALDNAGTIFLNQGMSEAQGMVQAHGLLRSGGEPGAVLTVGDFASNGGTMVFNTALGDNSSATDRLVINGALTNNAATLVQVVNVGGLGGQTTGDGILLIQTSGNGASAASTFQLAPGARVSAGAYDYSLVSGAGANASNLYLSSAYMGGGGTSGGSTDGGGASGGNGGKNIKPVVFPAVNPYARGPGVIGGVAVMPNYRVEVALAGAIAPVATEYGYAMLDTLHERVGAMPVITMQPVYQDRVVRDNRGNQVAARSNGPQMANNEPQWFSGAWGRLIGDRGFHNPGSFEKHGSSYDYTFGGVQAGLDIYGREQGGSMDKAGIYFGYGNIDANVKGAYDGKAGKIDSDAYSLGGYWTHKDVEGWYSDAVVQGTWYNTDATSSRGQKLKPDGFGIIASLEGGYSYKLGNGLAIEPQAQLAYQNVSFDSFSDAYGRFNPGDAESLRGRVGLRLNKDWNAGGASTTLPFTTWVRANVWHEFMGDQKTSVTNLYGANAYTLNSPLNGTWGEIGAGVTGQVNENVAVFGTGAYNHSLDNKGREAWDGRVGVNVKW